MELFRKLEWLKNYINDIDWSKQEKYIDLKPEFLELIDNIDLIIKAKNKKDKMKVLPEIMGSVLNLKSKEIKSKYDSMECIINTICTEINLNDIIDFLKWVTD